MLRLFQLIPTHLYAGIEGQVLTSDFTGPGLFLFAFAIRHYLL